MVWAVVDILVQTVPYDDQHDGAAMGEKQTTRKRRFVVVEDKADTRQNGGRLEGGFPTRRAHHWLRRRKNSLSFLFWDLSRSKSKILPCGPGRMQVETLQAQHRESQHKNPADGSD